MRLGATAPAPPVPSTLTLCPSSSTAQLRLPCMGVTLMVAMFWATSTWAVWLVRGPPGLGRVRQRDGGS